MYCVYILESEVDHRYYVGQSDDLERRLAEHERGEVKSTRPYRPWKLVHVEWFATRSEAMRREREIKRRKKRSFIESVIRGVAQPG